MRHLTKDLAADAQITANNIRGGSNTFSTSNLMDQNRQTYWSTDDNFTKADILVTFQKPTTFNVVLLREYLPLGQRIFTWALDRWENNELDRICFRRVDWILPVMAWRCYIQSEDPIKNIRTGLPGIK